MTHRNFRETLNFFIKFSSLFHPFLNLNDPKWPYLTSFYCILLCTPENRPGSRQKSLGLPKWSLKSLGPLQHLKKVTWPVLNVSRDYKILRNGKKSLFRVFLILVYFALFYYKSDFIGNKGGQISLLFKWADDSVWARSRWRYLG